MLLDFPDESVINLLLITDIGPIGGAKDWLRYKVQFIGGGSIEVFETRKYASGSCLRQMPRAKLIKA